MHGATRGRHEGLAGPEHPSSAPTSHGTEECGRRGGSLKDRALPHTASLEVRTNLKPNRTEVYFLSLYPQDGDGCGGGEVCEEDRALMHTFSLHFLKSQLFSSWSL